MSAPRASHAAAAAGIAQGLDGHAHALFSLPTTLRRYMSCTGLCDLLMVKSPRGLGMVAFSMAWRNSAFFAMSPPAAFRPTPSIWAAS